MLADLLLGRLRTRILAELLLHPLVLGDTRFSEVVAALHPVQESIGREINPVVYQVADFRDKLKADNTWAREVLTQPKIFLMGSSDDFTKLVGDTEAGAIGEPSQG